MGAWAPGGTHAAHHRPSKKIVVQRRRVVFLRHARKWYPAQLVAPTRETVRDAAVLLAGRPPGAGQKFGAGGAATGPG